MPEVIPGRWSADIFCQGFVDFSKHLKMATRLFTSQHHVEDVFHL